MPLRVHGHTGNFTEIDIGRKLQDIRNGAVTDLRRLLGGGNNDEENDGEKCDPHATSECHKILRATIAQSAEEQASSAGRRTIANTARFGCVMITERQTMNAKSPKASSRKSSEKTR